MTEYLLHSTSAKTLTVALDASVAGTNTGDQTLPTRDSLGLDTDDAPQFAGINIGHATDTTLSRVSAGVIAVEGVTIPTLDTIYPVGCIYTSTVSTNPATVFGFGTWAAFGAGQVLVGKAASGTFATAGATGGVETVALTAAQSGLPAHNHNLFDAAGGAINFAAYTAKDGGNVGASPVTGYAATTSLNSALDAASSHTNLQPYIVVYYFTRTA